MKCTIAELYSAPREQVFDPGAGSHFPSLVPSRSAVSLISSTVSLFLVFARCNPVFLQVYTSGSLSPSLISTVCFSRDSNLADAV